MSRPRLIKDISKNEQEFKKLFYGSMFINPLGDYIYSIKIQTNNNFNHDYNYYLLSPLNENDVKRLMQKSLEVGKDLILEECKNRPYNYESRQKEIEEIIAKRGGDSTPI